MNEQKALREKITFIATRAIAEEVFPGCAIGVIRKNGDHIVLPFGNFTYEHDSPQVQPDTVYDVASVTKSIPTSSLALYLIDQGKLRLDDALIKYVPEYEGSNRDAITIYHLLTQTLQFSFTMASVADLGSEVILKKIFHATLLSIPGSTYHYANATSILLGMVIERVLRVPLETAAEDIFFRPLAMMQTTFDPSQHVPPSEIVSGKIIQSIVHDESTRALLPLHVGAAGLFASAPDLLHFLQMLLADGVYDGKRFLSAAIIRKIYSIKSTTASPYFGLGWELSASWMGKGLGKSLFGKTGFTGCMVACDPEKGIGIVMLSNHTFPKRTPDKERINSVRRNLLRSVLLEEGLLWYNSKR